MTKQEYADYERSVSEFRKNENIRLFSAVNPEAELYFSWYKCDCCKRLLGGNREVYHSDNGNEYELCEDCVYYNEYGRLDDATMAAIGN